MGERLQPSSLDEYLSVSQHLRELFLRPSPSGAEKGVRLYCRTVVEDCGFQADQDAKGNLIAWRGEKDTQSTLLTAHMDTPQQIRDVQVMARLGGAALALPEKDGITQVLGQDDQGETVCIGADDKCGLAIILAIAELTDLCFKVLLTVEQGNEGAGCKAVDAAFYTGLEACLALDQPGNAAIVSACSQRALASDWFVDRLVSLSKEMGLGYWWAEGASVDAHTISRHVPQVVALSVGFGSYPSAAADYAVMIDTVHAMRLVTAHLTQ